MGKKKDRTVEEPAAPEKMKRKVFEHELHELQVELTRLQAWVKAGEDSPSASDGY